MSPPLVSCICPTFGRPPRYLHLLEEAVESFVRQDYPNKELLILNDHKDQTLRCNAPNVRVINESQRYETLGSKYNAIIEQSRGELICPWEDDDISLPHRITYAVAKLGKHEYWNPKAYWLYDLHGLHHTHGIGVSHNCSIYRREAWVRVGGYPPTTGDQDGKMEAALVDQCDYLFAHHVPISEWFFIYRWGVQPYHLSGRWPHDEHYDNIGKQKYAAGEYEIVPSWKQDYDELCRNYIDNI